LFGDLEATGALDVPGNNLAMLNQYLANVLWDFKCDEESLRPEAAILLQERAANLDTCLHRVAFLEECLGPRSLHPSR
jgi:hypothetical protein